MNGDIIFICLLLVGAYIVMGLLVYGFETIVMDKKTDDYELAFLIFWPIVLLVGAICQLIHFIITAFKGEF